MIKIRSDYLRYLLEDRKVFWKIKSSTKNIIKELIFPGYIYRFQKLLRKAEYYKNVKKATEELKTSAAQSSFFHGGFNLYPLNSW